MRYLTESENMLKQLNRRSASRPQDKPVKILQFGKGNFLRAFVDWMVDVMNEKAGFNGAVQIVQVNSTADDDRFQKQDGLYHVVVNGIQHNQTVREIRLIAAVDSVINPFRDRNALLRAAENPHLEFIVSNTTEAGITFDKADSGVDTGAKTFPGKLTALLYHRFKFFNGDVSKAPVILPCELIERNGGALQDTILQYISHWNLPPAFRAWITDHVGFCNTLVDRIVPGFPKANVEEIWQETGYRDELVVSAEPYHVWVIEPIPSRGFTTDKLKSVLPLEQSGINVKFTTDLSPYRTSKVRILNGAHTSMVPVAWLRGLRTVREAINDPETGAFIRDAISEEIIPTLDLSQAELQQFTADVIERFQNPFVRHDLSAIALNSVSKFQVRVLPSILGFYDRTNRLPKRLLQSLGALIVFYRGEWNGEPTPVNDTPEVRDLFREAWRNPDTVVRKVLSTEKLWKTDLTKIDGLVEEVEDSIFKIQDSKLGT